MQNGDFDWWRDLSGREVFSAGTSTIVEDVGDLRSHRHTRGSVDSGCVEDSRRDGLVSRGDQRETVGPCIRARVRRRELVLTGKYSDRIGTGERDDAVDDGIPRASIASFIAARSPRDRGSVCGHRDKHSRQ